MAPLRVFNTGFTRTLHGCQCPEATEGKGSRHPVRSGFTAGFISYISLCMKASVTPFMA